jgi:hypothetical protein
LWPIHRKSDFLRRDDVSYCQKLSNDFERISMTIATRTFVSAMLLAVGLLVTGCGKDPKKYPVFNEKSLQEPAGIKMGADARSAPGPGM